MAEKLVDPESLQFSGEAGRKARAVALSCLEHEIAHLNGGLNMDQAADVGMLLEELRVIYLSNGRYSHIDARVFADQLHLISGIHPYKFMKGRQNGGSPYAVFAGLANSFGLDRMLDLVMLRPQHYAQKRPGATNLAAERYLGHYDGVLQRIIDDKMEIGEGSHVYDGVHIEARRLMPFDPSIVAQWFAQCREWGLNVVTDMIERCYNELVASAPMRAMPDPSEGSISA